MWIKGTIKDHAEWQGVKETHLTRVSISADEALFKADKARATKEKHLAKKAAATSSI